ncbi:ABC1 kinase family protein [Nocardia inohanensis]|uniref:ABC1 kinase family protein n=1 Tax=Nocardia inohanensis TaxID=209246 RepID=UPI000831E905|nr:AarF/ABC1/UbiB kinase family protein [Nocardia inohanensis]
MPEPRQGGLRRLRRRSASANTGQPPTLPALRNAKIAVLPVAYAARKAGGLGRRAAGQSKARVDFDIQARTAQHMFEVLGELKGCAAKFGQLLALYELALPPELGAPYREALSRLQDSAPAMLPAAVHQAMAAQLGPQWRTLFAAFDSRATAAASVGQVHRATWHDGRRVAVKLMYPGARESVRSDLAQIRRMAPLAAIFMPGADVQAVTDALIACIDDELDYAKEAAAQQIFAAAFAGDPDFVVPRVVHQQGDVVISEWLDGIPLTRVIASGAQQERDRVGVLLLRFVMNSFTRTGLLYTDTHPGNFRVLRDGRLGVVDYGACSPFPAHFPHLFGELADAELNGTPADLKAALRRNGFLGIERDFDIHAFKTMIEPISALIFPRTVHLTTSWLRSQVLRATEMRLSNVVRQLTTPAEYTPIGRTMLTTTGVLCQLGVQGALRDEVFAQCPELAAVLERFNLGEGPARDASTSATVAPRLVSVPCTSRW